MKRPDTIPLPPGGTVAVIGGGPAGAFFAIHLLRLARELQRGVKVVIFERRWREGAAASECPPNCWSGCNYCAGGISPKLSDVLNELGLNLPPEIIQDRIRSLTVQGYWKNIELDVPAGREMVSVYRGSRPNRRAERQHNFDSYLLAHAVKAGAELVRADVTNVTRNTDGRLALACTNNGSQQTREADFVVFAAGVNSGAKDNRLTQILQQLAPGFVPPRLRRALIFELEDNAHRLASLEGTIHFVEYGSRDLPLEMCSLVPKRHYVTVALLGRSVDTATAAPENMQTIRQFLDLPHIRKLLPRNANWQSAVSPSGTRHPPIAHPAPENEPPRSPPTHLPIACICNPNIVVGSAKNPFADRVAAVGDMVTTRLYKDGILSAERTAAALARTLLEHGLDATSLKRGYAPTLLHFQRDNRFAAIVFLLHRIFFGSSILSRILYQAVITERKTCPAPRRRLERILWRIASGDDDYKDIFFAMLHPATIWKVLAGGAATTLRNYITEIVFGLRWDGFGRFTTGVALENLESKRLQFSRVISEHHVPFTGPLEFERMYTIKIHASRASVLDQLGRFGEPDRAYLHPRWVHIHRTAGQPNIPGCVITYAFLGGRFAFSLRLEQIVDGRLAVYRVQNGFARGGVLLFDIEDLGQNHCALSIYVTFNFARGNLLTRPFWWCFRHLFPDFAHDVVWNHSLCKLKDVTEST